MESARNIFFIFIQTLCLSEAARKPNILFIVADDLGWNDVSWNNPDMITPTLDKLARKGVILNSTYVQPMCSPSRGSIMTGYFPYHLGMQHGVITKYQPKYMPVGVKTLPESLKEMGYATHMVGKWHLGFCNWKYTPTKRGFDSFYGFYSGAEDYYDHTHYGSYDFRYNTTVYYPPKGKYSTSLFASRGAEIVRDHDKEKPLFLYLSFQGVHSPLQAPKRYTKLYSHIKNKNRRIYNGMVTAMDEAVAKVMTAMRKYKLTNNLLVVFSSDNGGASYIAGSNWPLRGAKSTLWEGGTRVPAFVYSKTLLKKTGVATNEMIHAVDWYPTLLRLAGHRNVKGIDGVDQWMTISKGWPSARSEFVYNINELTGSAAIRVGNYKLIVGSPGRYNGWYMPKTKPLCNRRKKGYKYQTEDRVIRRDSLKDKREKVSKNGWWFSRSVSYLRSKLTQAAERTGFLKAYATVNDWYRNYRCDKFHYAHKMEEKQFHPSHVQLYNVKDDPLEKFNIADQKPKLLKKIMKRLEHYKKSLVPSQHPTPSKWGHPRFFDGIWSPGWC